VGATAAWKKRTCASPSNRHRYFAAGRAKGGACASDAFYPFPDGIEAAASAGVAVIVQPGGAMRDEENIAKADELGIAMVFTGERHFLH